MSASGDNTESYYVDPLFNPSMLPRRKKESKKEVNMVLPFTVQCLTCGEFMAAGSKFNSKVRAGVGCTSGRKGGSGWGVVAICGDCNVLPPPTPTGGSHPIGELPRREGVPV